MTGEFGSTRQERDRVTSVFHMPFPRGAVLLLQQGNFGPADMSHSEINCLHALDFTGLETRIVASADGMVSQIFSSASPGDHRAGFGFGNFVKLQHPNGLHSFYAHLDAVHVSLGEQVSRGQQIGTMGNTGWAGNRHLHFSIHPEPHFEFGVGPTCEIEWFITREFTDGEEFRFFASSELKDFRADTKKLGVLYVSENDGKHPPLLGAVDENLETVIETNFNRMNELLSRQKVGEWLFLDQ